MRNGYESLLGNGVLRGSVLGDQWPSGVGDSEFSPVLASINVPNYLPNASTFRQEVFDLAWPQVLAFCGACIGVVGVIFILRAFQRGG